MFTHKLTVSGKFMKRSGRRLLGSLLVLIFLIPVSPISAFAEEPESNSGTTTGNPFIERAPEIASLFFQPIYAGGKFVIGVFGVLGSGITAITTGGDEEAVMNTLRTTWADPWTLNDAIRNENADPFFGEIEKK